MSTTDGASPAGRPPVVPAPAWHGRPVLLCCDAANATGMGHFVRSTALAQVLSDRGADVRVLLPPDSVPSAVEQVRSAGWSVEVAESPPSGVHGRVPAPGSVVVVDSYRVDGPWLIALHRLLAESRGLLVVLDDLADRRFTADLVVNPALGAGQLPYPSGVQVLGGPAHALLRPEFAASRAAALQSAERLPATPRRVLSLFGGTDVTGMAAVGAEAAVLAFPDAEVRAVVPPARRTAGLSLVPRLTVLDNVPHVHEEMLAADLVVSAGGTTLWELCCLARPTAVVAVAENQLPGYRALAAAGAVLPLAEGPGEDATVLADRLSRLVASPGTLSAVAGRAATLTDGRGAERVADEVARLVASHTRIGESRQ